MTPEQKSEYIEQKRYEAADRRAALHDELARNKAYCKAAGKIWIVNSRGFSGGDRRRMENDPFWFPRNASMLDFGCITTRELRDEMRRAGLLY